MENNEIAKVLDNFADLLEIKGGNEFRVRSYREAARTVGTQSESMKSLIQEEDITELSGIGESMRDHIREIIKTGTMEQFEDLKREMPETLVELIQIPGIGPKKTKALWQELEIETLDDLEQAAEKGQIAEVEGFGQKTQENILEGIQTQREFQGRHLLSDADQFVKPLREYLEGAPGLNRLEIAGSYRRRAETVGDIDLLAIASEASGVMDHFTTYEKVEVVQSAGETRGTVVLDSSLQVDLRIVESGSFGSAFVYFTGSKQHGIHLRQRGIDRGLRVSEYGVFKVEEGEEAEDQSDPWSGEFIAGENEQEVYRALDLPWIPPVLREDRGEIQAAEEGQLPQLIQPEDLRGDLQMHSTWSDGKHSLEAMVRACLDRGYEYCAITDHTQSLAMTGGLDEDEVRKQTREVSSLNQKYKDITLLHGLEVEVLEDGSLDLSEEILGELDIVLISLHSHLRKPPGEQTKRILKAMEQPNVNILAHPTSRKINEREPMEFSMEEVLTAAAERGIAVELNAQPTRLDLKDAHILYAGEMGVKVAINTDAHRPSELDFIDFGIDQAQRGWLRAEQVINTMPLQELRQFLQKDL